MTVQQLYHQVVLYLSLCPPPHIEYSFNMLRVELAASVLVGSKYGNAVGLISLTKRKQRASELERVVMLYF